METKEQKIRNKGITLIALVVTVVVTIIIAMVSIATLTGDNSTISNAEKAKEDAEIAEEKELLSISAVQAAGKDNFGEITEDHFEDELTNNIGKRDEAYELTGTGPFIVKYLDSQRSYLVDEYGNVSEYVDISKYVKVGQYVDYNPTVSDKNGTTVDPSKLTYTSPKGDGQNHGNGNSPQTYTAKVDIKWKVLEIGMGTVTLISDQVTISKDEGGTFILQGAIGYLYVEQELHEICKIYGYGYGADTSQVTEYSYGGPIDGELTGKITGSGARSLTVEDINKLAGIKTDEDIKTININYGSTANPTIDIWYPTITKQDGNSGLHGVRNLENTNYDYDKSKIKNAYVQNMIFNGNWYWLASRAINTNSNNSEFKIFRISGGVGPSVLVNGNSTRLVEYTNPNYAVCPIVTLKSEVIDIDAGYDEANGGWQLK